MYQKVKKAYTVYILVYHRLKCQEKNKKKFSALDFYVKKNEKRHTKS